MNKPKYIWWVGHENGSIGAWNTRKGAEDFIKNGFLPKNDGVKWTPIKHEVAVCPTCGKYAEKDLIEGLGECLSCDHVRGEYMDYMRSEREEEYEE